MLMCQNREGEEEAAMANYSGKGISMHAMTRWFSDRDWRLLLLIIPPLTLLLFFSISTVPDYAFPSFSPIQTIFSGRQRAGISTAAAVVGNNKTETERSQRNTPVSASASATSLAANTTNLAAEERRRRKRKEELRRSKLAVCLVGGARRFELTGPSIVEKILKEYSNSDLFLHSPLDQNAYKFSLLKSLKKIASVKIFKPEPIPETESQVRVLTAANSPNGIQGLLQYFTLVEGCITMIKSYQTRHNFTYDWIVRTRVDGYWNAPLDPENFISGLYVVPPGSSFGGLVGIGDFNTSTTALSRLSMVPNLDSAGFRQLNSESAFKAQLTVRSVPFKTIPQPFCVVSDRKYPFPPGRTGVPVAALSSAGPLSGAKCRPCTAACEGECVEEVMGPMYRGWSWTEWRNGTLKLCNATGDWERGWERIFDRDGGREMAKQRREIAELRMEECVDGFEEMKRRTEDWLSPSPEEICKLGLTLT